MGYHLGHEANKIFLGNMLQGERKTPALLFYGPDGIGKKKLAYEFARSFLCLDDPTHDDCKCRSCRAFCGESHPDFIYVEGQGARHDILIEQIKEVEKRQSFPPSFPLIRSVSLMVRTACGKKRPIPC